jgi:hypothetical protein
MKMSKIAFYLLVVGLMISNCNYGRAEKKAILIKIQNFNLRNVYKIYFRV